MKPVVVGWIAFGLVVAVASIANRRRTMAALRPFIAGKIEDGDLVRSCGFKVQRPASFAANSPFGRVHVSAEAICVRSIGSELTFCVSRDEGEITFERVQLARGLHVAGEHLAFDLVVDDLDSLVLDLERLGWLDAG